jgi:hypothetical protein
METNEALIIQGTDGSCYAVPRGLLERCRLPAELASAQAVTGEVSGYAMNLGGRLAFQSLGLAKLSPPSAAHLQTNLAGNPGDWVTLNPQPLPPRTGDLGV